MLKVKIIAVGSLKEEYLRAATAEYLKRLSAYCEVSLCELKEFRLPERPSDAEIAAALESEAGKILAEIPQKAFTVTLCVEGKEYTSEQFAGFIDDVRMQSGTMCIIIGSSYGLCEELKKKCSLRISASDMTFPHQLFRIMLLEQIYRAFKIIEGGTYHK